MAHTGSPWRAVHDVGRAVAATVGLTPTARQDPARIVLGLTLPIGDTLFVQPAVAALRRRYPQARLTAIVYPTNAALAAVNPDIDDLITYHNDPTDRDFITRFDAFLPQVHHRRFDMFVSFSPGSNCIAILSGVPRQVWQRLPFCFWLWGTTFDAAYRERHAIDHYWQTLHDLGIAPRNPTDRIPIWQVSAAEQDAARVTLTSAGIADDPARPLILLHPGAAGFGGRKRWHVEAFGELANHLITDHAAQIVVLGAPVDVSLAAQIVGATAGRAVSLAGQTSLLQSIAIITQARVYVGNDSGLTHFAVALQRPTVALFGVSDLAQFAPRAADPRLLRLLLPHPVPAPAGFFIGTESGLFAPPHPVDDRMEHISVARVCAAVASLGLARAEVATTP